MPCPYSPTIIPPPFSFPQGTSLQRLPAHPQYLLLSPESNFLSRIKSNIFYRQAHNPSVGLVQIRIKEGKKRKNEATAILLMDGEFKYSKLGDLIR